MNRIFLTLLALIMMLPARGENADSIKVKSDFSMKQLVLPVSLVGAGSLGFVEPVRSARVDLRDHVNEWRGDNYVKVDDYIQYIPMASIYGLSLLGAEAKHNYVDRTLEFATASIATAAMVRTMKFLIDERRPDGSANNSFPSGHTATTFMGAELVRLEYGDDSPWYSVGAYTIACTVGALRVYNNRHWVTDVVAGAGLGILGARIGYWLLPYTRNAMHKLTGWDAFITPAVSSNSAELSLRFVLR